MAPKTEPKENPCPRSCLSCHFATLTYTCPNAENSWSTDPLYMRHELDACRAWGQGRITAHVAMLEGLAHEFHVYMTQLTRRMEDLFRYYGLVNLDAAELDIICRLPTDVQGVHATVHTHIPASPIFHLKVLSSDAARSTDMLHVVVTQDSVYQAPPVTVTFPLAMIDTPKEFFSYCERAIRDALADALEEAQNRDVGDECIGRASTEQIYRSVECDWLTAKLRQATRYANARAKEGTSDKTST